MTLVVTTSAFAVVFETGYEQLRLASRQRLLIGAAVLRSAIDRYDYLPAALALDSDVRSLLDDAGAPAHVAVINAKFEAIARESGAAAIYVMDRDGLTLSASNWNQPLSFVGISYAYRPYFVDAVAVGISRYFGVGTTTSRPGLFIGKAVTSEQGRITGVVVVKIELDGVEDEWRRADERILVSDQAGVVFLASDPAWKYRPLLPVAAADRARIRAARQYGDSDLRPLLQGALPDPGGTIRLPVGDGAVTGLAERVAMPTLDWTLWYVAEIGPVIQQALLAALAVGIACLAFAFALAASNQRRARLRSEQVMRRTLEGRVADRTRDLTVANERLRCEITEREQATAALRSTQDELIHAGRLAALGQISMAINHEINQPLAALQTFLSSTVVFLQRGDTETVGRNLTRMTEVTRRIAGIIRHLKAFARKTGPEFGKTVHLAVAAEAALDLLGARIRADGVAVTCSIPPEAAVRAEPVRLEQVIVNLVSNALDAMHDGHERHLDLAAKRELDGAWRLSIADSGGGIPEEHMPHVFDPFYTTEPAGEGLGLGLSLSSLIVRDFGGILSATNEARGARLSLVLPAAEV